MGTESPIHAIVGFMKRGGEKDHGYGKGREVSS